MSKLNISECRVIEQPFRYAVLKNFADREMLLDIDASNLSQMPKAFYVNESVPQIFMNELDPSTFEDGTVFKGKFENGYMRGEGEASHSNGDLYIGMFERDMKHGFGKYCFASGNVYEGYYQDDQRSGFGRYY